MKVLQILPELNVGGVETGTMDLARALIAQGHKAYVVSAGGKRVPELIKMGAQHLTLPVNEKTPMALWAIPVLRKFIEQENIDIVHARSRVPAWVAYFATRPTQASFITTCHGYYSTHILSRIMGWGKRVIVISHAIGRHMIEDFHVPADRIRLIHRGVDLSRFEANFSKYDKLRAPGQNNWVIGFVGRLTPIKGVEYLIEALHVLIRRIPNVELWLVGDASPGKIKYKRTLEDLVKRLGLENHVKFLGEKKDIGTWLSQMDVLVLPTIIPEGFGRVLVEAASSGTAVISTRVGGVLDVIDHEENGLLVDPCDAQGLTDALCRLLSDPKLTKSYAQKLEQKVKQKFSLNQLVEKTLQVYEEAKREKKIVVFKLSALGDLILIVPSLRMLKKRFPYSQISVVVDEKIASVLDHCPYIDQVIVMRGRKRRGRFSRFLKTMQQIRKQDFDFSIDFQNNKWTHILAWAAGIPKRLGYKRGVTGKLLTDGLDSFNKVLPPVRHQFQILERLGLHDFEDRLELWVSGDEEEKMKARLEQEGLEWDGKPVIGLVVNASIKWKSKNWPLDRFLALAEDLMKNEEAKIVLIGQEGDSPAFNALKRLFPKQFFNMLGKTTVREMFTLINQLDCLVTPDSAPLHVAAALGVRVVSFFGPTDPVRHLPPSGEIIMLRKPVSCSPCYLEKCNQPTHRCMEEISLAEMRKSVIDQIRKPKKLTKNNSPQLVH